VPGLDPPQIPSFLDEARLAWPGIRVDEAEIVRFVADKLEDRAATGPRVADLYIAYACIRGDSAAIAAFEERYFAEVRLAAARFADLPITFEDLRQRLRERFFLGDPPGLAGYSGQGDLRGWVRASALNMLINVVTRETRERPKEGAFFDAILDGQADAEAAYLKLACRADFQAALVAAFAKQEARDKSLLRYAFADGLGVDEVGAIFRVHRATAARWIAKARDRLVKDTREELMARLGVAEHDAESIVRAALSGVGSWARALRDV
jgi:RNA polymerase sigma-70 factor, ECF subfamily